MYYQIVILCLVQRASVLRFTGEITPIAQKLIRRESQQPSDSGHAASTTELADEVSSLYGHYIDFLNRLYLREITAQVQGDELYTQLQNQMELKADVDNLGRQLNELNTYVASQQQKEEEKQRKIDEKLREELNNETRDLNTTIGWFAPLAVIGGLLSFIGIDKLIGPIQTFQPNYGISVAIYVVLTALALVSSPWLIRKTKCLIDYFEKKWFKNK